jgi:hypothetical protein
VPNVASRRYSQRMSARPRANTHSHGWVIRPLLSAENRPHCKSVSYLDAGASLLSSRCGCNGLPDSL